MHSKIFYNNASKNLNNFYKSLISMNYIKVDNDNNKSKNSALIHRGLLN